MESLYYVVIRWLESENSPQNEKLKSMIIHDVDNSHLLPRTYDEIFHNEAQKELLIRERERLIQEKEKLEQQKRIIEMEREENIRLMQERERLQREKQTMEEHIER